MCFSTGSFFLFALALIGANKSAFQGSTLDFAAIISFFFCRNTSFSPADLFFVLEKNKEVFCVGILY